MPNYMQDFGESMEQINKLSDLFKKTLEPMIPGETVGERAAGANVMTGLGIGGITALSAFAPQLWAILTGAGPAIDKIKPMATRSLHGMAKNPKAMGYSRNIGRGSRVPMEQGILDVNKLKEVEAAISRSHINKWRVGQQVGAGRWQDSMFPAR